MLTRILKAILNDVILPPVIAAAMSMTILAGFAIILALTIIIVQSLPQTVQPYAIAGLLAVFGATAMMAPYVAIRMQWQRKSLKDAIIDAYVPWCGLTLGIIAIYPFG